MQLRVANLHPTRINVVLIRARALLVGQTFPLRSIAARRLEPHWRVMKLYAAILKVRALLFTQTERPRLSRLSIRAVPLRTTYLRHPH